MKGIFCIENYFEIWHENKKIGLIISFGNKQKRKKPQPNLETIQRGLLHKSVLWLIHDNRTKWSHFARILSCSYVLDDFVQK